MRFGIVNWGRIGNADISETHQMIENRQFFVLAGIACFGSLNDSACANKLHVLQGCLVFKEVIKTVEKICGEYKRYMGWLKKN